MSAQNQQVIDTHGQADSLNESVIRNVSLSNVPEKALESFDHSSGRAELEKQTASDSDQALTIRHIDFLWNTHKHINEGIRYSDTKAGFIILFATGIIGALYTRYLHKPIVSTSPAEWTAIVWSSSVSFLLLGISILCAVWTIKPRLQQIQKRGHIFWDSIAVHETSDVYWKAFQAESGIGLQEHLATDIYTLAIVCKRKFAWLNASVWFGLAGSLIGAITLFIS